MIQRLKNAESLYRVFKIDTMAKFIFLGGYATRVAIPQLYYSFTLVHFFFFSFFFLSHFAIPPLSRD